MESNDNNESAGNTPPVPPTVPVPPTQEDIAENSPVSLDMPSGTPADVAGRVDAENITSAVPEMPLGADPAGAAVPPMPPLDDQITIEPEPSSKKWLVIVIVLLAVALLTGGAAAAFYTGLLRVPFLNKQLSAEQVLDRMYQAAAGIDTASYSFSLAITTEPREAGIKAMGEASGSAGDSTAALVRDQQRLNDAVTLLAAVKGYKATGGEGTYYPRDLLDAVTGADKPRIQAAITAGEYGYRQETGGLDFTLNIQLETEEAARKYAQSASELYVPTEVPPHEHEDQVPWHPHDVVSTVPSNTSAPVSTLVSLHAASTVTPVFLTDAGSVPLPLDFGLAEIYPIIPVNFDMQATLAGRSVVTDAQKTNAEFSLNGSVKLDGATFSASGDMKLLDRDVYVKVNEFPSLGFFDLGAVRDQWIHIPADEEALGDLLGDASEVQRSSDASVEQYKNILLLAHELDMVRVVQEYPLEEIDAEEFYHYEIDLAAEQLPIFYERLLALVAESDVETVFSDADAATLEYLQGDEFTSAYEALRANTTMEIWINAKTFQPARFTYRMRFVPPNSVPKFANKQIAAEFEIGLSDINQPISITAPAESIDFEAASSLITGKDVGLGVGQQAQSVSFDRQTDQIPSLRQALRTYWLHTGVYPGSLADLRKRPSEVTARPVPPTLEAFDVAALNSARASDAPFMLTVPTDPFTQQPYLYTSTGQDFTLQYQIVLPPEDVGSGFEEANFARKLYVDGTNTATATSLSVGAGQAAPTAL